RRRKAELVGFPAALVEDPEDVEVAVAAGNPVITGVIVLRRGLLTAGILEGRLRDLSRASLADDACRGIGNRWRGSVAYPVTPGRVAGDGEPGVDISPPVRRAFLAL